MAISSFSELKTAISNWTDRTDLSARLPEFIALFEAKINRKLIKRQQTTSTTLTPTSGSATLPSDYLAWKRVTWTGDPRRDLDYVTPSFLQRFNASQSTGNPTYFTIEGSTLKVAALSDTGLDFLYSQKVPALSDGAPTNWFLTANPDAYLFGSLTMLATLTEDASNGPVWNDLTQQAIGELWENEFQAHGPLVQRTLGPTP